MDRQIARWLDRLIDRQIATWILREAERERDRERERVSPSTYGGVWKPGDGDTSLCPGDR